MKNNKIRNTLLAILVFMFQTVEILAKNQPPAPKGSGGFGDDVVVGGPIDDYLPMLFFVALAFGAWALNRSKKASVI